MTTDQTIRGVIVGAIDAAQYEGYESAEDLADRVIEALGGVKQKREYGRVIRSNPETFMFGSTLFKEPNCGYHTRQQITFATPWKLEEDTTNAR